MSSLDRLPPDLRDQLDRLTNGLHAVLGENLVGAYLHGSLVLGCFNPQRSDVDVLVATKRSPTESARRNLLPVLRASSGPKEWPRTPPYPLELTLLPEADLHPWRYPTPYDLHFSQTVGLVGGGVDHDLAAHFTVLHEAGLVLAGPPVEEIFPTVPREDFLDSLRHDLAWCREQRWKFYSLLSASRIWATFVEGGTHSKASGAEWALARAPTEFRPLLARALALYRGEIGDANLNPEEANRYVDFVAAELDSIAAR